jgi:MFS family permease
VTDDSREKPDAFAALRLPYVPQFALGRMVSTIGAQFVSVAIGWELYERTNDPWMLGLVGLAQVAPALVLTIPAGNVADRYPRRNVGLIASLLSLLVAIGLTLVSWYRLPVELVFGLLMLSGVARAFAGPSTGTLLAQLLKPKEFQNAYAWLVSSGNFASIAGPGMAGLLIAVAGSATPSYVVAALCHCVFIGTLLTLPVIPAQRGQGRTLADMFAGVAFIRRSPVYLGAISLDMFGVLLGGAVALLPVYARDILMVGPAGLGLLRAAPSVGAMCSALLSTRLPPWRRPGVVLLLMVAGFGLSTIGFGLSRNLVLSMVCLFFIGAFDSISMVIRGTLQQVMTPDHLRGRVAAVSSLFIGLSNEMGAFESGAAAALFGPVIAVVGGGIGTLVVVGAVMGAFPQLARIGPLHTLSPEGPGPLPAFSPSRVKA